MKVICLNCMEEYEIGKSYDLEEFVCECGSTNGRIIT